MKRRRGELLMRVEQGIVDCCSMRAQLLMPLWQKAEIEGRGK